MRWGFKGVLSVWLGMGDRHWACFLRSYWRRSLEWRVGEGAGRCHCCDGSLEAFHHG